MYGMGEFEAAAELRANNLNPAVNHVYTDNQCYVIGQNPNGGTVLPVGSTVTIIVAVARGYCEVV
jgi:beta-lactam-binding protein with PASTA domain